MKIVLRGLHDLQGFYCEVVSSCRNCHSGGLINNYKHLQGYGTSHLQVVSTAANPTYLFFIRTLNFFLKSKMRLCFLTFTSSHADNTAVFYRDMRPQPTETLLTKYLEFLEKFIKICRESRREFLGNFSRDALEIFPREKL